MGEFSGRPSDKPADLSQVIKIEEKSTPEQFQKDFEALQTMTDTTGEIEKVFKQLMMGLMKIKTSADTGKDVDKEIIALPKKILAGTKLDNKIKTFLTRLFQEMYDLS